MRYGESDKEHLRGLRSIAAVEIFKGCGSLLLAIAVYSLLRQNFDLQEAAFNLLDFLCIDSDRHWARTFTDMAGKAMLIKPVLALIICCLYAALRFIEGFGLWFGKVWAEWFALVSGALFLPLEVYEIFKRQTALRWGALAVNIVIVIYLALVIQHKQKQRKCGLPKQAA